MKPLSLLHPRRGPETHRLSEGCVVEYHRLWLQREGCKTEDLRTLWRALLPTLRQYTRRIEVLDRQVNMPRLEAFYGEMGHTYDYSGVTYHAQAWPAPLKPLLELVRAKVEPKVNAAFCNLYRTGADSIGWHADNEVNLGPRYPADITIVSISLGATRRFRMKPNKAREVRGEPLHFDLAHGDLLVMRGACQRDWLHCLVKTKKPVKQRINLTFRVLV